MTISSMRASAVLQSKQGTSVTLLNWSGKPVKELTVSINDVPGLKSVRSARLGKLSYRRQAGRITLKLPMPQVVDVLLLESK